MEWTIIASVLMVVTLIGCTYFYRKSSDLQQHVGLLKKEGQRMLAEYQQTMEKLSHYLAEKTEAETHKTILLEHRTKLEHAMAEQQALRRQAEERAIMAEKQAGIIQERLSEMERRMQDWDKTRAESMAHAKAAMFEAGSLLSKELLATHNREQEIASKSQEERIKITTEALHQQFTRVVASVSALGEQVQHSGKVVDVVRRALLSPSGAGSLAEITLENLLKASGLVGGKDFFLQHSLFAEQTETRLRPDAIVYLPSDHYMIIDSKASKFFVELASIENGDDGEIKKKLMQTMHMHLKALASRDYKTAFEEVFRKAKEGAISGQYISTIMFLPSDTALETLLKLDANFMSKAWELGIFPVGPAGLINILSHARFHIMESRRSENYEVILEEVKKLLASLATVQEHGARLGKSLQSSLNHFDKFAGTFNGTLLGRARKLHTLGISQTKGKMADFLPLERYQLVNQTLEQAPEWVEEPVLSIADEE
jgi:DNA recombination protein RmuC